MLRRSKHASSSLGGRAHQTNPPTHNPISSVNEMKMKKKKKKKKRIICSSGWGRAIKAFSKEKHNITQALQLMIRPSQKKNIS
jgi:hypothetical protein